MAKMIRTALPGATCQAAAKRPTARQPCAMRSAGCLGHRAGELMHAHADRIQNLEMAGGTFGPDAAGSDRSAKRWRERNPGRRGAGSGQGAYFRTRSPASGARPRPTASQHDQAAAASAHAHRSPTSAPYNGQRPHAVFRADRRVSARLSRGSSCRWPLSPVPATAQMDGQPAVYLYIAGLEVNVLNCRKPGFQAGG